MCQRNNADENGVLSKHLLRVTALSLGAHWGLPNHSPKELTDPFKMPILHLWE